MRSTPASRDFSREVVSLRHVYSSFNTTVVFFCFLFLCGFLFSSSPFTDCSQTRSTRAMWAALFVQNENWGLCWPRNRLNCMKLMSFNVRGLNAPFKRHALCSEIKRGDPDMVCLQETHFRRLSHPLLQVPRYTTQFHATGPTKSRGVSILLHDRLSFQLHRKLSDPKGRYLILVCTINQKLFTICNIYSPNSSQISFLKHVLLKMLTVSTGEVIVMGDFNVCPDSLLDRSAASYAHIRKQCRELADLLSHFNLYDVWRVFHPGERGYTLFSPPHNSYSRIDFFCIRGSLLPSVRDCDISSFTLSDHAPVFLTLADDFQVFSRPPWRLNDTLLGDPEILADLQSSLDNYFSENKDSSSDPTILWRAHKAVMRGVCIRWAAIRKRQHIADRLELLTRIDALTKANQTHPNPRTARELAKAGADLTDLDSTTHFYALQRLRANRYSTANRVGHSLALRLRTLQQSTRTSFLLNSRGERIYKPQDIANEFATYYRALYNIRDGTAGPGPSVSDIRGYLDKINLPTLSQTQRASLASPITCEEIAEVITSLPKGKAPGPDGFTSTYYKTFHQTLLPHIHGLFTAAMDSGNLPSELLNAAIVTLPKLGKPPTSCQNFRPISLINVDLKIYTKILANRLALTITSLIGMDQVGFIPGRQGPDNTRRLLNLIQVLTSSSTPGLILSLDAEKAFDRVHWGFMSEVMAKFSIPPEFVKGVFSVYASPSATVRFAGFHSRAFPITNGTRQGCPLSPLLYALVLEPLAQMIRQSDDVRGIEVGPQTHKLNLFADDVLLTLTSPKTSLEALTNILHEYGTFSYHKINFSKTQALPVNIPDDVLTTLKQEFSFDWRTKFLTYLGIKLALSPQVLFDINYGKLLIEIKTLLRSWHPRRLSWFGRIAAVKMTILPKILYVFRALPIFIPRAFFSTLQGVVNAFLWNYRRPRIKFPVLSRRIEGGGLGVPDFAKYSRAVHVLQR
uniref:Reverse transcriptase domain-containing protein n=1 Tax=Leptobrachium leishanense TaxID=445787 RepID=A0A8C5N3Y4_9ANUR